MSLKSRSFLHRVNDQVRKRQSQSSKDATKNSDKHFVFWWMFMSSILWAWERIIQTINMSIKIQQISHWNRCSTCWRNWYPNNQMGLLEWLQFFGKILHGSINLWSMMRKLSVSRKQSLRIFRFCIFTLERRTRSQSQWNSSGIFPGFTTLQLCNKVQ